MKAAGIVYVLINPSFQGLLKIGKTERSSEERARELSIATGVPTPFIVAFEEHFDDCVAAEKLVHALLEEQGCRVTQNREFFSLALKDAVRAVSDAKELLGRPMSIQGHRNRHVNLSASGDSTAGAASRLVVIDVRGFDAAALLGTVVASLVEQSELAVSFARPTKSVL